MSLIDKRDKLTSKLFTKKIEKMLYLCTLVPEKKMTPDIHDFIFRQKVYSEMSKSQNLSRENPDAVDICFTVDVY